VRQERQSWQFSTRASSSPSTGASSSLLTEADVDSVIFQRSSGRRLAVGVVIVSSRQSLVVGVVNVISLSLHPICVTLSSASSYHKSRLSTRYHLAFGVFLSSSSSSHHWRRRHITLVVDLILSVRTLSPRPFFISSSAPSHRQRRRYLVVPSRRRLALGAF
jgi:hypothetical protein